MKLDTSFSIFRWSEFGIKINKISLINSSACSTQRNIIFQLSSMYSQSLRRIWIEPTTNKWWIGDLNLNSKYSFQRTVGTSRIWPLFISLLIGLDRFVHLSNFHRWIDDLSSVLYGFSAAIFSEKHRTNRKVGWFDNVKGEMVMFLRTIIRFQHWRKFIFRTLKTLEYGLYRMDIIYDRKIAEIFFIFFQIWTIWTFVSVFHESSLGQQSIDLQITRLIFPDLLDTLKSLSNKWQKNFGNGR